MLGGRTRLKSVSVAAHQDRTGLARRRLGILLKGLIRGHAIARGGVTASVIRFRR